MNHTPTTMYEDTLKPALVDLVVERELVKNKTAARKMDKADIIRLLEVDDIKRRGAEYKAAKQPDATHGVHGLVPSAHAITHSQPADQAEAPKPKPVPLVLASSPPKKRVKLTSEQRQNKLRRNRRKHRRALAGRSARRGTGQISAHA